MSTAANRKPQREARRKLRVLALVHESLVPPESAGKQELAQAEWKTEYDVVKALRGLGHEVHVLGVGGDLGPMRAALTDFQPQLDRCRPSFDPDRLERGFAAIIEAEKALDTNASPKIVADWLAVRL